MKPLKKRSNKHQDGNTSLPNVRGCNDTTTIHSNPTSQHHPTNIKKYDATKTTKRKLKVKSWKNNHKGASPSLRVPSYRLASFITSTACAPHSKNSPTLRRSPAGAPVIAQSLDITLFPSWHLYIFSVLKATNTMILPDYVFKKGVTTAVSSPIGWLND